MRTLISLVLFVAAFEAFAQNTYYSRITGNWSSNSTWSTVSCSGGPATSTPGPNDNVVICAGRTVTFNAAAVTTIANLTIELTGVFDINVNRNLILNSLVLNGTVTGNGGGDLRVGNLAGSTLSGSGIFSTSTTGTQLLLVNNVTVLAGSDVKFDDDGRFNLNGRTLTNNGKVSVLEPSTISGGGIFVNNASTSYLLFTRAGNWPNNTVLTATATGNTVEYGAAGGTRALDNQSSYYHLVISGGGTKRFRAANTTIRGNLTISNGSTLDMNTGTRNLSIAGNWINNLGGTFNENTSLVTFNGSANSQTLAPRAGGETFYNLTINNTFAGGSVTSSGNVSITSGRTLTMTAGIFDMGTNTLGQTGAANLTATGGDLRLAKLTTTLPEFTGTYNITGGTITFNGSAAQTIRSLNTVPANYHNIALSSGGTKTLGGNITVRGNWSNTGTTLAGNFTVNFAGSGIQTITNTSGEVFYGLTVNTNGPLTLQASTNVTVANTLTMTSGNINLNNRMLTVGNGSGATLARTAGICYSGTFRRYFPLVAISSTVAPRYGLFPVGTSIYYRPVEINSTANPTTAGYVSVVHTDATTATDVSYNDNEGQAIQRISDMQSSISTAALAGGTYTLSVSMTTLSSAGLLTDLKMETIAGPPYGVGITVATTGTVADPTVIRSGLTVTQLNNTFVVGTRDKSTTPMVSTYFSRRTGNWNDATIGNSTWSLTDGGGSCNCVPTSSAIVYINSSHTVSIVTPATTDFIIVRNSATLAGTANLTLNYNLTTEGTGKIAPTAGSWSITRDLIIAGTSASTSGATLTINGNLEVDAANSLTASNTIQATGNLIVDGTLAMGSNSLTLLGTGSNISGSLGAASITGSSTITMTNAKTILSSSTLIVQPIISLSANTTVTNLGTVIHTGDLTGANATTSVWTNGSNSVFNTTGAVLATGTLNANASPNTINYNGSGAQTVKSPASSYYNLIISNAGIKSLTATVTVTNNLTIQDAAILNAGTNTLNGAASVIMNGTSELQIGKAADLTYPELTGSYSLNSGTVTFNPSSSNAYDIRELEYFNLNLNGSGASTYDFNSGVAVNNDLTVTLAGTARIRNMDAAVVVTNDFIFNSTSSSASSIADALTVGTFTLTAGSITPGNVVIEITDAGGWTRNGGTFTPGGNTVVLFSGPVDQQIGGSVATTFTDFELANSGPTGVIVNQDVTISDVFTFTEGNLVTSGANILTIAAGSNVLSVSDDSFVDGPMLKTGNTDFTFPVGKDGIYRPISISTLSASGTFQAEYFHSDPSAASYDVTLHDVPALTRVNSGEYWILNRTSGTPNAFVTLSWDSYSGTVDQLASLRVAKWNGSTWNDLGNGAVSGSISPGTGTIRTAATVSVFSPFTLAASNGNNPLPIVLLDFQAKLVNDEVEIDWTTASELNNDYFTLEKTRDAKKFEVVAIVPGAGTTQVKNHYAYIDDKPYSGIFYYRLKQTDFDGKSSYSNVIAVDNRGGIETPAINVFPNPTDGIPVQVSLRGVPGVEDVTFEMWDVAGKKVKSQQATTDENGRVLRDFDTNFLSPGFYIIKALYSTGTQKVKLIVN